MPEMPGLSKTPSETSIYSDKGGQAQVDAGKKEMIVGLTGLAGSGKSEVAHALKLFAAFHRHAFADPLKDMLKAAGFTHEQLYGDQKATVIPEFGQTSRFVMQTLGTEWARETIHPDFWLILWGRKLEGPLKNVPNIVADDCRFPNEVAAIRERGGKVWRIERPGTVALDHASEKHELDVDEVIVNDGDLCDLQTKVFDLLRL